MWSCLLDREANLSLLDPMVDGTASTSGQPWVLLSARIAVAKSICGAPDWHRASRVPGPDADLRRGAPATNTFCLRLCITTSLRTHLALGKDAPRSGSATPREGLRCRFGLFLSPRSPSSCAQSLLRPEIFQSMQAPRVHPCPLLFSHVGHAVSPGFNA